jgi:putative tricarboxylic transport membrane protein
VFKRKDILLGVITILFSIFIFIFSRNWEGLIESDPAGPAAAPRLLACGIFLLGAILSIGGFYSKDKEKINFKIDKTITVILLLSISYILFLKTIGYLIITPVFIGSIMWTMLSRDMKEIIIVSISSTVVLFAIFSVGLNVELPKGILSLLLG